MLRYVFAAAVLAAPMLLQIPAYAHWQQSGGYWSNVVVQGNDASNVNGEMTVYSELPSSMTPNDTDSISGQAGMHYVWSGSGGGTSIRYDITGSVWGLAQGLYLNGSGHATSTVDGPAGPLASGYCSVNNNYGTYEGDINVDLTFSAALTEWDAEIYMEAETHLFHGSMGGGTAAANAAAHADFSATY